MVTILNEVSSPVYEHEEAECLITYGDNLTHSIKIPVASEMEVLKQELNIENKDIQVEIKSRLDQLSIKIKLDSEDDKLVKQFKDEISIEIVNDAEFDRMSMDSSYGI